jgi:flagellar export protein FliJ
VRRFHFRPQPALDLRLRQEEAAEQALARAREDLRVATDGFDRAQRAIDDANAQRVATWSTGRAVPFEWHRNWIVGLERDVARARSAREERRIEHRRAAELAREARKQVKVLERLKARAVRAWQLDTRRDEQKTLDELASLRFALRMRARLEESDERNQSDRQCRPDDNWR